MMKSNHNNLNPTTLLRWNKKRVRRTGINYYKNCLWSSNVGEGFVGCQS